MVESTNETSKMKREKKEAELEENKKIEWKEEGRIWRTSIYKVFSAFHHKVPSILTVLFWRAMTLELAISIITLVSAFSRMRKISAATSI